MGWGLKNVEDLCDWTMLMWKLKLT